MKNLILLSFVLIAVSMIVSCEKEEWNYPNKITGEGEIVTQSITLNPFSRIELEGVANLYVNVGAGPSTILKAQQNIIDILTWKVASGTLTIGLKEGITLHKHEEIRFDIDMPVLTHVFHNGIGHVILMGNSQDLLAIDFRGIGDVYAYGLPVNQCEVLNSGTGDCKVKVNETLEVDISSLGKVFYRGNPEITFTDAGLGDLINDN